MASIAAHQVLSGLPLGNSPGETAPLTAIRFPRAPNLIGRIRSGIWIEFLPTLIAPIRSAISNVYGRTIENCFVSRTTPIWDARTNKRSAPANAFGIRVRVFLTSAGLGQSPNDATYRATCARLGGLIVIALVAVALAGLFPGSANFAFLLAFALGPLGRAVQRKSSRVAA